MKCLRNTIVVAFALTVLVGCKQADPNPEEHDPIFKDLEARATVYAKTAEEARGRVTTLIESLAKVEPNSVDKKQLERDLEKTRITVRDAEQWSHFYKIRSARRKVEDKIAYRKAFEADQAWPPKEEWAEYQVNRQLVESSRDWNRRVPKLSSRAPAAKAPAKGGEHGGGAPKKHE